MRLAPCVLLPAAVAAAKASLGNLYIYDDKAPAGQATLEADAARLVIASRLGLDQYHSLQGQQESALLAIDRLSRPSSFVESQHGPSVALILSAVGQDGASIPYMSSRNLVANSSLDLPFSDDSAHLQTVHIKNSPSFQASEKLVNDLAYQSGVDDTHQISHSTISSYDGPSFRIAQDAEVFLSLFVS